MTIFHWHDLRNSDSYTNGGHSTAVGMYQTQLLVQILPYVQDSHFEFWTWILRTFPMSQPLAFNATFMNYMEVTGSNVQKSRQFVEVSFFFISF